ncbi:MAG: TrkA family potassium uptake protein [Clostridia bacterium]|nr:TrkA family potassium uptake protein [Clostridia bacterium]
MKSFLIIGIGKFGYYLCRELSARGCNIMAADMNEEALTDVLPYVVSAKIGNCTRPDVLKTFGVDNYDACIVCIDEDFQNSLQVTALLSEMGARRVVSFASTEVQAKFLRRNGADRVIFPEEAVAERLAVSLSSDSILDQFELSDELSVFEIQTPAAWVGKSVLELNIRARYGISVLATKRDDRAKMLNNPNYVFNSVDSLMVMGSEGDIRRIDREKK